MTTRPDDSPWPAATVPVIGAVLVAVAFLSLLSRPWSQSSPEHSATVPANPAERAPAGPTELATGAGPTSAPETRLGAARGARPGPTEIDIPGAGDVPNLAQPIQTPADGVAPTSDANTSPAPATTRDDSGGDPAATTLCERIGAKLSSVSVSECLRFGLRSTGATSILKAPIVSVDYLPKGPMRPQQSPKVLLLGGIHGDEYSSVTIMFKWLAELEAATERPLHWRILPLLNPDGLLRARSQRMNERGVDLNRNFPTPNWEVDATDYWVRRTGRNPRRYPGPSPLSEPESRFLHDEIARFKPDVIVAVHAPLEVVDFDGPNDPPDRLGSLYLRRMGTYPGSLGRYGGEHVGLPVVTIELPSAGTMPPKSEQRKVWNDLGDYLERTLLAANTATTAAAANP